MQYMESMKKYLTELMKKENRMKLIMLLGAAAIAMICFSDSFASCFEKEKVTAVDYDSQRAEAYARELEEKLCELISSIDGAGEVRVMVTLQNGIEYIYASEDKSSVNTSESKSDGGSHSSDVKESSENNYILIDSEEGERALVRTELMPTVNGIVIVCGGANDPEVVENIKEAVTTALDISEKRVSIIPIAQ